MEPVNNEHYSKFMHGPFYYNPDDHRVFVNISGLNGTLNFARRISFVIAIVFVVAVITIIVLGVLNHSQPTYTEPNR